MLKEIGERVRQIRGTKSQTEFANLTKTKQTSISRLEKGINEVGILTVINICNELGVSADWLLLNKEHDQIKEDEKELLNIYRSMSEKNKQRLIGRAENMLEEQAEAENNITKKQAI